jgi:hypothetical protein
MKETEATIKHEYREDKSEKVCFLIFWSAMLPRFRLCMQFSAFTSFFLTDGIANQVISSSWLEISDKMADD